MDIDCIWTNIERVVYSVGTFAACFTDIYFFYLVRNNESTGHGLFHLEKFLFNRWEKHTIYTYETFVEKHKINEKFLASLHLQNFYNLNKVYVFIKIFMSYHTHIF